MLRWQSRMPGDKWRAGGKSEALPLISSLQLPSLCAACSTPQNYLCWCPTWPCLQGKVGNKSSAQRNMPILGVTPYPLLLQNPSVDLCECPGRPIHDRPTQETWSNFHLGLMHLSSEESANHQPQHVQARMRAHTHSLMDMDTSSLKLDCLHPERVDSLWKGCCIARSVPRNNTRTPWRFTF